MKQKFNKYHGAGNDFIIIDRREAGTPLSPETAAKLCHRNFGIGADGVLTLLKPKTKEGAFYMHITNSDGSIPEMCGNGIRCMAHYIVEEGLAEPPVIKIDTDAGLMTCRVHPPKPGEEFTVTVDMGKPRFSDKNLPPEGELVDGFLAATVENRVYRILPVSMGNPHAIIFYAEASEELTLKDGPILEKHELFPEKTNVEFVRATGANSANIYVWERGAGFTMACGTGACATAAAGVKSGLFKAGEELKLTLPGGDLFITIEKDFARALMRGPSKKVFEGVVDL